MHFQVRRYTEASSTPWMIDWVLVKADGSLVARSGDLFGSEKEARSDIASAKKSMKGAGRCKVLSPGEEPS